MLHRIQDTQRVTIAQENEKVFGSPENNELVVYSVVFLVVGLLCYAKAVPHYVGLVLGLIAVLLAFVLFALAKTVCGVRFNRAQRIVTVVWEIIGIEVIRRFHSYSDVLVDFRDIGGLRIGGKGVATVVSCPRFCLQIGSSVYAFEPPLNCSVSEESLSDFKKQLGFVEDT